MYNFSNTDNIDKSASITNLNLQQDNIKLAGKAFSTFILYSFIFKILFYILCKMTCNMLNIRYDIDLYRNAFSIIDVIFITMFIRANNIKKQDIFLQKCKFKDIAVIIPLMILMLTINLALHYILQLQIDKDTTAQALLASSGKIHGNIYFYFARLVIITPIIEEIIFRGIMLKGLCCSYGHRSACIITSSLFGMMHCSITLFASYFIDSLLISYITVRIKSIWPAIFAHIINNFIVFLVQLYPSNAVNTDDISTQEIIIIGVLMIFAVLSVSLYLKHINKQYKQSVSHENAQGHNRIYMVFLQICFGRNCSYGNYCCLESILIVLERMYMQCRRFTTENCTKATNSPYQLATTPHISNTRQSCSAKPLPDPLTQNIANHIFVAQINVIAYFM